MPIVVEALSYDKFQQLVIVLKRLLISLYPPIQRLLTVITLIFGRNPLLGS